ncbi:hypothetical protein ROT99_22195 [Citrobacter freundii complex sp. 2023EL-00966]|nr:hypothetical protein [Citrobacter freundii complex sp. 2023EL-00966]MDT3755041.1 hypothetical protein [Citrobacter freundii complex sp. 2023EL-00966]
MCRSIIKTFLSLIVIYTILMVAVFSLPSSNLNKNIELSKQILNKEGAYYTINNSFPRATQLDNFTDLQIMLPTMQKNDNALEYSMDMKGYARYWHGYSVFLRPMLSLFPYEDIRFFYSVLTLVLLCTTFYFITYNSGFFAAISFAISMIFIHIEIFGLSMQFSNIFIITMIFMIIFSSKPKEFWSNPTRLPIYFFLIGSVVNFIDLLTSPVVSLTLPLILSIIYMSNHNTNRQLDYILTSIKCSISWGIGYASTWIAKWLIASVILSKNVPLDALNQMIFRVAGDQQYPTDRLDMLKLNFLTMFTTEYFIYILIGISLLSLFILKRSFGIWLSLFMMSVTPYVWYLLLANHSQIHYFFTYRSQVGTLFAMLLLMLLSYRTLSTEYKNNQLKSQSQ